MDLFWLKMKRTIILCVLQVVVFMLNAQALKVGYVDVMTMQMRLNQEGAIANTIVSTTSTELQLIYYNGESLYESVSEPKTETGEGNSWLKMDLTIATPAVYKNFNKKELISEEYIIDKKFLVSSDISNYSWSITKDEDVILNKRCFKATCESIHGLVIAWFCPDIPICDGPYIYSGLPGLILKLEVQNSVITATSINLTDSNDFVINKPNKGKKVKRDKYEELLATKLKESGAPGTIDVKVKLK